VPVQWIPVPCCEFDYPADRSIVSVRNPREDGGRGRGASRSCRTRGALRGDRSSNRVGRFEPERRRSRAVMKRKNSRRRALCVMAAGRPLKPLSVMDTQEHNEERAAPDRHIVSFESGRPHAAGVSDLKRPLEMHERATKHENDQFEGSRKKKKTPAVDLPRGSRPVFERRARPRPLDDAPRSPTNQILFLPLCRIGHSGEPVPCPARNVPPPPEASLPLALSVPPRSIANPALAVSA